MSVEPRGPFGFLSRIALPVLFMTVLREIPSVLNFAGRRYCGKSPQ